MGNKNPKVSVVLPVYNTGKYLGECLDSVIGQTLAPLIPEQDRPLRERRLQRYVEVFGGAALKCNLPLCSSAA